MNRLPAEFEIFNYGIFVRLVQKSDAAFIVNLRQHNKKSIHLSKISNDVEMQEKWLESYKIRELNGEEYYLIFEDDTHKPFGLIRLYDFVENTFTSGSWIMKDGIPEMDSFKADLIAAEIGFDVLKFEKCVIDVRKENKKVVAYHKKFFTVFKEDEQNFYLSMNREQFEKKQSFLKKII